MDPLSMGFPVKNTGVGCHFLLQGIFWTWGSNLGSYISGGFFATSPRESQDIYQDSIGTYFETKALHSLFFLMILIISLFCTHGNRVMNYGNIIWDIAFLSLGSLSQKGIALYNIPLKEHF